MANQERSWGRVWRTLRVVPPVVALLAHLASCGGAARLNPGDRLFVADVTSPTGDLAFETAVRQAAITALQQTPHFWVVGDGARQRALRDLQRPADQVVTGDFAREFCGRLGARLVVNTAIAAAGTGFTVAFDAVDCKTSASFAHQATTAASREDVITKTGEAMVALRASLGEPAESVKQFQTPITAATTSSMEALRAFALGNRVRVVVNDASALPFFERAVELDPAFAAAWLRLGVVSSTSGQVRSARLAAIRAYEFRERATEYDRLYITWNHAARVRRDDEATRTALEQLVATFPRDFGARNNLGVYRVGRGEFDQALSQYRIAAELSQDEPVPRMNIAYTLLFLGRRDEAYQTMAQMLTARPDGSLAVTRWLSAEISGDARAADFEQAAVQLASRGQVQSARANLAAWHGQVSEYAAIQADLRAQAVAATDEAGAAAIDAALRLTRAALVQGPAIEALRTSLRLADTSPAIIAQSAALFASMGQLDAARALLPRVEQAAESHQSIYLPVAVTRAYLRSAAGQAKDAVTDLQATIVEFPQALDLSFHLARLREQAGDLDGAIAAYRAVVQVQPVLGHNPSVAPARTLLAEALRKKGDAAGAKAQAAGATAQWSRADADVVLAAGVRVK
jgi:tetratricopeptide (TPR) repeat protein